MKRFIVLLLLLLLGGAVVNIAVACAPVYWLYTMSMRRYEQRIGQTRMDNGQSSWSVSAEAIPNWTHVTVLCTSPPAMGGIKRELSASDVLPAWANAVRPKSGLPQPTNILSVVDARGWPMLALLSIYESSRALDDPRRTHDVVVTGVVLPIDRAANFQRRSLRVFPVTPIWPGFAINTLFYAALLWLLFAAPFALRKRRRINRGLCPKCAYDLRGRGRSPASDSSVCPECGTAL